MVNIITWLYPRKSKLIVESRYIHGEYAVSNCQGNIKGKCQVASKSLHGYKEIKIAARVDLSAILLVFFYNYSQVVLMKFIAFSNYLLVHVTCTHSCDYSEL